MDLFTEKYRPQSLDAYIGNVQVKSKIAEYIKEGTLQNLLLFGPAGTGKTSLAKLIVKQLEATYLYINASDERGIDTIRDKIIPFASSIGGGLSEMLLNLFLQIAGLFLLVITWSVSFLLYSLAVLLLKLPLHLKKK
jgi:AAA+ ATPase superfamily predicted ATPase